MRSSIQQEWPGRASSSKTAQTFARCAEMFFARGAVDFSHYRSTGRVARSHAVDEFLGTQAYTARFNGPHARYDWPAAWATAVGTGVWLIRSQ